MKLKETMNQPPDILNKLNLPLDIFFSASNSAKFKLDANTEQEN